MKKFILINVKDPLGFVGYGPFDTAEEADAYHTAIDEVGHHIIKDWAVKVIQSGNVIGYFHDRQQEILHPREVEWEVQFMFGGWKHSVTITATDEGDARDKVWHMHGGLSAHGNKLGATLKAVRVAPLPW